MSAMRKREKEFQDKLQRALSSVSFNQDNPAICRQLAEGDTTEEEGFSQEETTQSETEMDDKTHAGIPRLPKMMDMGPRQQALADKAQPGISEDRSIVAIKCVAELSKQIKSLQTFWDQQLDINQSLRSDLEDSLRRLAEIENAMGHDQREQDAGETRRTGRVRRQR
ncbi:hypothetical protein N7540_013026 [Penicillium herquei]|nr:hypothetical protein N7540_013026 [Penicillium herquei]